MPLQQERGSQAGQEVSPPTGTVFVMGLYLLALIVAWSAMFLMLAEK